jgi:hypothetical protein
MRLASPAPERQERAGASNRLESTIHNTCVEWAAWHRSRCLYGSPRRLGSVMEQLVRVPGRALYERDARIDPDLAAFHQAIVHSNNPAARRMFELQFLLRCNVSSVASQVGISRTHWYRVVNDFARRAYAKSIGGGY